ncbi:MAG: double-strand break repair protein AddB [Pseudomonadota bacterium]
MSTPRLYGVPPGADFAEAVLGGLEARYAGAAAEVWGRMTIIVNAGRMARRLRACFEAGPARLLPKILPVSDLGPLAVGLPVPQAMPRLTLVLHLARLLDALTDATPDIAPKAALFDLAHSLADLIDELEGEGAGKATLDLLDVGDLSAHWQRSRSIVSAAYDYVAATDGRLPGSEAQRRRIVQAVLEGWRDAAPPGPFIVAGSTGSRGATRILMAAVARLPNGAVILPGFDFGMPESHWTALDTGVAAEDHPQYRFRALMRALGLEPSAVEPWSQADSAPDPKRNALLSLALCPAPVTDRWRRAARELPQLVEATAGMALLEAPSPRLEARAIAVRLREAVETGERAALITPDRDLSRQVAAALARWGIEPDDSGGTPLQQTPPGRLLRMSARLMGGSLLLPEVLAILKHPLAATGGDRGAHLLATRELELFLRRKAVSAPDADTLHRFAAPSAGTDGACDTPKPAFADWAMWVASLLTPVDATSLASRVAAHLDLAERIARGADGAGSGALWHEVTGTAARAAMEALSKAAPAYDGALSVRRYADLVSEHLARIPVTDPRLPHPDVMIWGTLEARVGALDLAILAGLNDGTWPALPVPDPWLNRAMRAQSGLLLPERQIGLAAHDFQQAIAVPKVLLTRALRDAEAATVPSRWLNRLTTLLRGLGQEGAEALDGMAERGQRALALAQELERPPRMVPPARRPAPRPPVAARPKALSVTRITTLIRDPYAIYAQYVLGLTRLAPLLPIGDARERGIALHAVMEAFLAKRAAWRHDEVAARQALDAAARDHLARLSTDRPIRTLWHARLMQAADRILPSERARLARWEPVLIEQRGALALADPPFTLTAKPDRIDRDAAGAFAVRDYKSGTPPSEKQVLLFEKQLLLEAAMVERGAFSGLDAGPVHEMTYLSLGPSGLDREIPLSAPGGAHAPDLALDGLARLVARYAERAQGYTAQRAAERMQFAGDYDHLSRHGEWDLSDQPEPQDVGPPE